MKLFILGATGGTGQCLVSQALAHGHHVTALTLPGTEVETRHARLTCIPGDARDAVTVEARLRGHHAVLSALGASGWGPTRVCRDAARSLVLAMRRSGVQRLVCITSAGLTDRTGIVYGRIVTPLFLRNIYTDKAKQEEEIRSSGLEWTLVRPMRLVDGPHAGRYCAVEDGPIPGWWIRRANVADFMLREAETPACIHGAPILAEPLTLRSFAARLGGREEVSDLSGPRHAIPA
jgi:putative NADH-flavin reductase